ncbi:39S ribosomal protein L2, mitochondrial-like [Haliotis rufescens]|uniref:39S ribosomal protein L2, mitochondrial-like n=1 Tax=Haliotis rufescens TaxID=6454 RepID=UPI00201E91B0|nr:39S ribosomal protein L2, mitochondrial-like [Haliotis rufescens]XP_046339482.2 39S ribosomal protein L2, mitochondrial-like [Haliotis rufescens]
MMAAVREAGRSVACLSSMLSSLLRISPPGAGMRNITTSTNLSGKMKFVNQGIDLNKYTLKPLPLTKSGGRDSSGRITNRRVGGGAKQRYRMVDFKRVGPKDGPPLEEQVVEVLYDPCRSSDIAVVAGGTNKRYILASQNMQPGDIIKTSGKLTKIAVRGQEGDAHPVGALPIGTLVHNLETFPGEGGIFARAAGTSAQVVRKLGDQCVLRLPSKREIAVAADCMATIGRVSNVDHDKEIIGSAGRARWFGVRPKSGLWHRKTGYNGRKIKPPKALKVYNKPPKERSSVYTYTV